MKEGLIAVIVGHFAHGLGQQILFPQEVPVGLVSTLLGGAYFMWCLRRL